MDIKSSYKSDVHFKYCFGTNTKESLFLRGFLLENLLPIRVDNWYADNPELIPESMVDKESILDVYMTRGKVLVDLEMQVSSLSSYMYKRFQYYGAKMLAYQLSPGEKFRSIRDIYQIIIVNDVDKVNPSLVKTYCTKEQTQNKDLPYYVQTTIYVFLPYIEEIVKEKEELNEFEAMLYLIYKGTLDKISYQEKQGVIKMLERMHDDFLGQKDLVTMTMKRFEMKEDFEAKYQMGIEDAKMQGIEQGIEQGAFNKILSIVLKCMRTKFNVDAPNWLSYLTEKQLDEIYDLLDTDISYEELEKRYSINKGKV